MTHSRGRFITFEGGEGVGKSTQIAVVRAEIESAGHEVVMTREPGGTPRAEQIRQLLLATDSEAMPPVCELLLMFAARSTHLENVIRPALVRGAWVVCDRFTDATYAYQGSARGMEHATIAMLETAVQGNLRPDLTVLLDAPVEVALDRARERNAGHTDRFEQEQRDFFDRVRTGYLQIAQREPHRVTVIDANQTFEKVSADIRARIRKFLSEPS